MQTILLAKCDYTLRLANDMENPSVCRLWRACTVLRGFNFSVIFLHHVNAHSTDHSNTAWVRTIYESRVPSITTALVVAVVYNYDVEAGNGTMNGMALQLMSMDQDADAATDQLLFRDNITWSKGRLRRAKAMSMITGSTYCVMSIFNILHS